MDPLNVLGWIVVGLVVAVILLFFAAIVFGIVVTVRDNRKRREADAERARLEGLVVPHFEKLEVGQVFSVDYANWKVTEIATEYEPERRRHRLRIEATELTPYG